MRISRFILVVLTAFVLVTCKKEPELQPHFEIESEVVEAYTSSAEITVQYSYNTQLKYVKANLSESVEMLAPVVVTADLNDRMFVVRFSGLQANTKYYYEYEYSNGVDVKKTEIKSFKTIDYSQPTVNTIDIIDITSTSAKCNANVVDDGGLSITERGVCWSSHQTPTVNDMHVNSVGETGSFTCELTGLTEVTTYYVRAFAKNANGLSYGEQVTFTTAHTIVLPSVTTNDVTFIRDVSAVSGGNVTFEGYGAVSERGVCWSTSENPTIAGSHSVSSESGDGEYTCDMTDLTALTTYYVRAYATNEAGTSYGEQRQFTTTNIIPEGALNGVFTACDKQVIFSKGNLQFQASSGTWRFADKQYDYIGSNNQYVSSYYNGWIDLFGWGTSGYEHGAVCYSPWSVSTSVYDYQAYGDISYNLNEQTGKADWGYNAISNGENTENQWRTLTSDEWQYILTIRETESGIRYAKARVNEIDGLILLPDNWSESIYELEHTNSSFSDNVINLNTWTDTLEANGAVFLPMAGYRQGSFMLESDGIYWSATVSNSSYANALRIYNLSASSTQNRYYGCSVRLVQECE